MAMVIHSSFSSSCSYLEEILQRSRPYPTETIHSSEKMAYLHNKATNFVYSYADGSSRRIKIPFAKCDILTRGQSLHSGPNADQITNSEEETCDFDQRWLPGCGNEVVERIFAPHQRMITNRFPLMAFSVANAFMLTLPPEALATTCEAGSSLLNMPILLSVALIGATVGGLLARQRRGEMKRLNDQLRQINAALRRQAKIESYAPTLSYAPVGSRISEKEVIVDPSKQELISRLKTGKIFLRNQDPEKAFVEFKAALELAQNLKDPMEEKKAARGLGASLQRQKKYREAIKYHSMVLAISERIGEDSGNTEAIGAIADCYTELGDLERAGKFYDKYIAQLKKD